MKQFTLELLLQLFGISAASGISYTAPEVHIIADNSQNFYHYNIENKHLYKTPLTADGIALEKIAKATKPDFEAITSDDLNYYIFGSGSEVNRTELIEVNKLTNEVVSIQNLDILYSSMKSFAQLSDNDFNIEGVVLDDNKWYFFNRGNGPAKANGIFAVEGNSIIDDFRLTYVPIKLPKINKVQSSFTDAVKVNNKIYFLATAEDTSSSYDDGAVKGSLLGLLDIKKMKVEKTQVISDTKKFEGITLLSKEKKSISFLICDDPDDDTLPANLYKLTLQ